MDKIGKMVAVIDQTLNTREKRHIVGGILMSVSLLFGGLAITVISLKTNNEEDTFLLYPDKKQNYIEEEKRYE